MIFFPEICFKRLVERRHVSDSNFCSEPVSYQVDKEDFSGGPIIEVFDDSNRVVADFVLLHGCPQNCMPNPVEGLLEIYEDIVEVLLLLEISLTEDL